MFFIFSILAHSLIPERFRELAEKALYNSTFKVPKKFREDTKYPGNYTFGNAFFILHKVLTSSQTNDIKGYAVDDDYAAIVKRKKFKIADGFTLLDIKTQEFYLMERVVASDDKISVYKMKSINMFSVFSDIVMKGKTPMLSFKKDFNWDHSRDRPILSENSKNVLVGAGASFSASFKAKARFKSLKKAEINCEVSLTGKIGAEFRVKMAKHLSYPDFPLFDKELPIPGFGFNFRFLGLKFQFDLSLTFGILLRNLEADLYVDVDYFRGYQFTAKRVIIIKRHGRSDSGWQTDFSPIPSGSLVDGLITSLESNRLSAELALTQGIKLNVVVLSILYSDLQFGLVQPFTIEFGFSPLSCPFPYMYGSFSLPMKAFISFGGIQLRVKIFRKKIKKTLLKSIYKEMLLFHIIKTRKFCLFDSKNNNDYAITDIDDGADEDDEFVNETSDKMIILEIKNLENLKRTQSLISFHVSLSEFNSSTNSNVQVFDRRSSQFEKIVNQSNYDTVIIAINQNRVTSKVVLDFWYYNENNTIQKSQEASFFLKEYKRLGQYVRLPMYNTENTEQISASLKVTYCESITINEMYVPSTQIGMIQSDLEFGDALCLLVKDIDTEAPDHIDEDATFMSDGSLSLSFKERESFTFKDEHFLIQLDKIDLPDSPDSGTHVYYEVSAESGEPNPIKSLLISNLSYEFTNGTNFIKNDLKTKFRMTEKMNVYVSISYVINSTNITMKEPITLSEIQKSADSENQTLIKAGRSISCTFSIERYKPIIIVNSSQTNSTHRVVCKLYSLNSVKPSEYKPTTIKFKDNDLYGVFKLQKIDPKIKWLIINMPNMQPLIDAVLISDDYYQIPIDEYNDTFYIPFRRENQSINHVTIKHVIQGNFVDEETIYFSSKYYKVDFDEIVVALVAVRSINNQYSITNIENTIQTLIDYGDESFQFLALEYKKDKVIYIASSLIIIDEEHPLAEKTIPDFPNWKSVIYEVWCERAEEIIIHDKTTGITIENNFQKNGQFFSLSVTPGHIIDFIPICNRNISQSMCYFKQTFDINEGYSIFRYADKNGITILDTSLPDLFEQEDRQGLIEEVINKSKNFYYMTFFKDPIQIIRNYKTQLDLELRVIDVKGKYKKFCIHDPDGYIIPVSRPYYTDNYDLFMNEFGIADTDSQYLDFSSGDDSCIYATYANTLYNDTDTNSSDYEDAEEGQSGISLLSENSSSVIKPSTKICDIAKSIKVSMYKDITVLIPPGSFYSEIISMKKTFEEDWLFNIKLLNLEIHDYFYKTKMRVTPQTNNSICILYLPYKEFQFNYNLNDDEIISSQTNTTVNYIGGNLNYFLPENHSTIIDLGESNEINLNLYGNGTLKLRTNNHSVIIINGTFNLDSPKCIRVNNEVKLIEIQNVNVTKNAELYALNENNEKVNISIINVTLLPHSKAKFTNIEIVDTFLIKQTATAILDNSVSLKTTTLIIDMMKYQNDLIPMITGSIPEPPKVILIQQNKDEVPRNFDDEYLILDGMFDCEMWIERMKVNNSFLNNARCTNNYTSNDTNNSTSNDTNIVRLMTLDENRAFIKFGVPSPNQVVVKESYMPKGMIVIIVFSVLDFLLLVFLITCLVIQCKSGGIDVLP